MWCFDSFFYLLARKKRKESQILRKLRRFDFMSLLGIIQALIFEAQLRIYASEK